MKQAALFQALGVFLLCASVSSPAETESAPAPDRLDGVKIEALETFTSPKWNELSLGMGISPLDPYYTAFSLNGGYIRYFTPTLGWEVISGAYAFTVQKDLVSQLATFGVTPD